MSTAKQTIVDFVEGRIDVESFQQSLFDDPEIEALLKDPTLSWNDTYVETNPYDYLICLRFDGPGDVLNAQGALQLFLERIGVKVQPTLAYANSHDLLLSVQPMWLRGDEQYLIRHILPQAGELKERDLKVWLKSRIRELFRYHKKPPSWIQSPAWPINENGPMFFVGQIKLKDCPLYHDEAAVYVFVDPKTGQTETITQVY